MATADTLWTKRLAGYIVRNPLSEAVIGGIGTVIDTVKTEVTNLPTVRESNAILERRAKERLLFFSGWETLAQKQAYMRTWYDVLTARGTRTGVKNELDRLVKGTEADPGVSIYDMSDDITGPELLLNGDFAAWTGDDPDNWTLVGTEDATNYVTESAAGAQAQIVSDGTITIGISQDILTVGAWLRFSLEVIAVNAGHLLVVEHDNTNSNTLLHLDSAGNHQLRFPAQYPQLRIISDGACDVIIDNASVKTVEDRALDVLTNEQYPDAPGAFLDVHPAILIAATNNSTIRTERDIERLTADHLVPVAVKPIFDWS